MYLGKSLAELDELADEMLSKSMKKSEETDDDLKPEDISSGAAEDTNDNGEEGSEPEEKPEGEGTEEPKADDEGEEGGEKPEPEDIKKSEDAGSGLTEDETKPEEEQQPEEDIKKSENSEEGGEEQPEQPDPEEIEKSVKNDFTSNSEVAKGVEASEFLGALVEVMSKSLSDVQIDLSNSSVANMKSTDILAKSLQASLQQNNKLREDNARLARRVADLEKSITSGMDDIRDFMEKISDSMKNIASQPAHMQKSVSNVKVLDRDFDSSINGSPVGQKSFESLTKSQVMDILTAEMYNGNPSVSTSDIIGYESGAPLRPDLQQLVASKIK